MQNRLQILANLLEAVILAQGSHLNGDVGHGMEFSQGRDDSRKGFGAESQIVDLIFEVVQEVGALLAVDASTWDVSHFDSWGHLAAVNSG